jgi:hypothetical protein
VAQEFEHEIHVNDNDAVDEHRDVVDECDTWPYPFSPSAFLSATHILPSLLCLYLNPPSILFIFLILQQIIGVLQKSLTLPLCFRLSLLAPKSSNLKLHGLFVERFFKNLKLSTSRKPYFARSLTQNDRTGAA